MTEEQTTNTRSRALIDRYAMGGAILTYAASGLSYRIIQGSNSASLYAWNRRVAAPRTVSSSFPPRIFASAYAPANCSDPFSL